MWCLRLNEKYMQAHVKCCRCVCVRACVQWLSQKDTMCLCLSTYSERFRHIHSWALSKARYKLHGFIGNECLTPVKQSFFAFIIIILVVRSMLLSIVVLSAFPSQIFFPDLGVLFHCWFLPFAKWNFIFSCELNWIELHLKINALILWDDRKKRWTECSSGVL